jgi:hypothetical protein
MTPSEPNRLGFVLAGTSIGIFIGLWIAVVINHYHPLPPEWWPSLRDNFLIVFLPMMGAIPVSVYRWFIRRFRRRGPQVPPLYQA